MLEYELQPYHSLTIVKDMMNLLVMVQANCA